MTEVTPLSAPGPMTPVPGPHKETVTEWALDEWDYLKNSGTVKSLILLQGGLITAFINDALAGRIEFTFHGLQVWGLIQMGVIIAFFMRKAKAKLQAQIGGLLTDQEQDAIEASFIQRIGTRNAALAKAINDHLNDVDPKPPTTSTQAA